MRKVILFLLMACIYPNFIFCQQSKIDSLTKVLKAEKEDTNKVKTLMLLGDALQTHDPSKALSCGNQGFQLAQKLNYKKGIISSLIVIGNATINLGESEKALNIYKQGLLEAKKINDSIDIAGFFDDIGIVYFHLGKIDSSLILRKKAQNIYRFLQNESRLASGYVWIGNIYLAQAVYPSALENYLKALKIYEKKNDDQNSGIVLINISSVYRHMKKFKKAKKYGLDAESLFAKTDNKYGLGASLYRLSLVYNENGELDRSIKYLLGAKKYFQELNNIYFLTLTFNQLGENYIDSGDYIMALNYLDTALVLSKRVNEKSVTANIFGDIGIVYKEQKSFYKSIQYLNKSQKLLKELNDKDGLKNTYSVLLEDYSRINFPDSALKYFNLYQQLSDTIYNEQTAKSIAEMSVKYETQKKEDSLTHQQKLITVKNASIKQQNYFLIGLAIFALIIAGLFVVSRIQSKKIGNQYKEIVQLQSELTHRTGNFFNAIKGMLSVALTSTSDKETVASIDKRVNTINHLFKTLYSSPAKENISFSKLLNSICDDFEAGFAREKNMVIYRKANAPVSKEEAVPLAFIITELLTNANKHAFKNTAKPEIHVDLYEEGPETVLYVWDNGEGLTGNEHTSDLQQGMNIIKSYCKTLNGKINTWNDNGFHFKMQF